jgi:hypothetical protein
MSNPISSIFSGSPTLDKATLDKTKRKVLDRPFDGQSDPAKAAQAKVAAARGRASVRPQQSRSDQASNPGW